MVDVTPQQFRFMCKVVVIALALMAFCAVDISWLVSQGVVSANMRNLVLEMFGLFGFSAVVGVASNGWTLRTQIKQAGQGVAAA